MITDQVYILHKRPYKDSSELIKLITMNHGIVDVIAKGSLRNKSKLKGQLQPFIPTQVNWIGRSDLKTLTDADQSAVFLQCAYRNHVSMLYCNELITLLRIDDQATQSMFAAYQKAIQQLQESASVRQILRRFEWCLCCELGYELQPPNDSNNNDFIEFDPTNGLTVNNDQKIHHNNHPCTVQCFQEFIQSKPLTSTHLNQISSLMRLVVNHLVNGKTIQSRELLKIKSTIKTN